MTYFYQNFKPDFSALKMLNYRNRYKKESFFKDKSYFCWNFNLFFKKI